MPLPPSLPARVACRAATALLLAAVCVAAAGLLAGGWLFWLSRQDALESLPRAEDRLVFEQERQTVSGGRIERHMIFRDPELGKVGVTISVPEAITGDAMPVVLVLGGFRQGQDNIAPFGDIGPTVLIGYDWPLSQQAFDGDALAALTPDLRRRALRVPGQMRAVLDWLDGQSWADTSRVSLVGYALGAVIAPSVQRMLQEGGHTVGWTVLANGGVGLGDLIASAAILHPAWARPFFGIAADRLLAPLEPAAHLPHLQGRFLVLSWPDGGLPGRSAAAFQALLPQSAYRVTRRLAAQADSGPGADLLAPSIGAARDWLAAERAIDSDVIAPALPFDSPGSRRPEIAATGAKPTEVVPAAARE